MVNLLQQIKQKAKKNSSELRIIRALAVKAFSREHVAEIFGRDVSGKPRLSGFHDINSLVETGKLKKGVFSRMKVHEDIVKRAVEFILTEDNVVTLSWGYKKVDLSKDEVIILPKLTRRNIRENIFRGYINHSIESGQKKLSRASFIYILGVVTTSDEAALSAIDYVTALLVTEPCETLQSIVTKCIRDKSERKSLGEMIEITQNFLKNQCGLHFEK